MMSTLLRLRTAIWFACMGVVFASVSSSMTAKSEFDSALASTVTSPLLNSVSTRISFFSANATQLLREPKLTVKALLRVSLLTQGTLNVSRTSPVNQQTRQPDSDPNRALQSGLVLFLLLGVAILYGLSQVQQSYSQTQPAQLHSASDPLLEPLSESPTRVDEDLLPMMPEPPPEPLEARMATLLPTVAEAEVVYPEATTTELAPPINALNSSAIPIAQPASSLTDPPRLSRMDAVQELIGELQSHDAQRRQKAIWQLAQLGHSQALQPLVDLLLDSDSQQRSLILAAMSEIGARSLKPLSRALLTSLQDGNPDVRINAIRDITRVYESMSQVSHLLSHALSDPDPEVQETARWALGHISRLRIALEPPSNNQS